MPASAISPATSSDAARRAPALIEVPRVDASTARCSRCSARLQARHRAEEQRRHDRRDKRERDDRHIQAHFAQRRHLRRFGHERGENRRGLPRDQHADQRHPQAPAPGPSISICDASRVHAAPSAVRTAISCRRPSDRASSRLPTLAHAISSTKPTAASSSNQRALGVADQGVAERLGEVLRAAILFGILSRELGRQRVELRHAPTRSTGPGADGRARTSSLLYVAPARWPGSVSGSDHFGRRVRRKMEASRQRRRRPGVAWRSTGRRGR